MRQEPHCGLRCCNDARSDDFAAIIRRNAFINTPLLMMEMRQRIVGCLKSLHPYIAMNSCPFQRHASRRTRHLPIYCSASSGNATDGEIENSRDMQNQQETLEESVRLDQQKERDDGTAALAEPQPPPAVSEVASGAAPPPPAMEAQLQEFDPEVQAAFTVRGKLLKHRVQVCCCCFCCCCWARHALPNAARITLGNI